MAEDHSPSGCGAMNYFTDGGIRDGTFMKGSMGFKVNDRVERSHPGAW